MAITSITRTSPISGNESVVTEGQIVTYTIVSDSPNDRLSATVTAGTAATSRFFSPPFTFVPGGVSTFTISTVDDAIAQNVNQNFFVNFVPEDENVVGDAPLTTINPGVNASNIVTIRDNDVVPPREASTLSIIGSTPNPVSEGVTSVTFQIRYTQGNGNDLGLQSFTVGTIDGTAVGGVGVIGTNGTLNDYNTVTRSFAFGNNPGSSTGNPGLVLAPGATQDFFVTVPILDDSIVEQDETFSLRLSDVVAPPGSVIIGTDTQVATIRDNDGPNVPAPEGRGTVRFEFANYSVVENQPFVELKVIREGGQNGVIQGSLSINTGTSSQAAQLGADFLSPAQTSVFFGDQDTTAKIIRIPIIDNPTPNLTKNFSVDLTETRSPGQTLVVNTATVQIQDNDQANDLTSIFGGVGFGNTTVINVREDAGAITIPIQYTGAQIVGTEVTINAKLQSGTGSGAAIEGEDYIGLSDLSIKFPSTIAPGKFPVTIPIIDDTNIEINESFSLQIDSVEGAAFTGSQSVVINIIDNDGVNGQPVVDQQPGINFPTFFTTDGDDVISGTDGNNTLFGNLGNDNLSGLGGEDTLYGGQGTDTLYGGLGNDFLYGNKGNDTLRGDQGEDILFGGQGDDIIFGEDGNDTLSGDFGVDTLVGGAGADIFVLRSITPDGSNYDIIDGFELGTDLLALKGGGVNGDSIHFSDLGLIQTGSDTVVNLKGTFEVLAILKNFSASSLSAANTISTL